MEQILESNHDGHRERLRQRLMTDGLEEIKPHELLEFLLCQAIPRQDVNALSHQLLNHFGDIRKVLGAGVQELMQVSGIGLYAAQLIYLTGRCARSCASAANQRLLEISNLQDVIRCVRTFPGTNRDVRRLQFCMDAAGRLLYQREICRGYEWMRPEILADALDDAFRTRAAQVVMVLCAGKRVSFPSNYDMSGVRAYADLLNASEISLLDMVIAGCTGVASMRHMHMIPEYPSGKFLMALREEYVAAMPSPEEMAQMRLD